MITLKEISDISIPSTIVSTIACSLLSRRTLYTDKNVSKPNCDVTKIVQKIISERLSSYSLCRCA